MWKDHPQTDQPNKTNKQRQIIRLAALGSASLLLTACGGGGGGGGGSTPAPSATAATSALVAAAPGTRVTADAAAPVASPATSAGTSTSTPSAAAAGDTSAASPANAAVGVAVGTGSNAVATTPITTQDAIRLLDQAAFGPTDAAIADVVALGAAGWLDAQFATPATGYAPLPYISWDGHIGCPVGSPGTCVRDNYSPFLLQHQFFKNAISGPDQLRQRVALAYSQIFVISGVEIKETYAMRDYQQMLLDNAFVNYRTLLEKVTLSPAMGDYLDMVDNDKPNPTKQTQANENFAREVMQLFSIGTVRLNTNGTEMKDANGAFIPAYDQTAVTGLARAFTGWTYAPLSGATPTWPNMKNYLGQMVAVESHHDTDPKVVTGNVSLPGGQSAAQDLKGALDAIFNHPNVGPFIGKQMIQFLVTSNPTPTYVARIAAVFNDNGRGVRGDMQAVIRAILLDPEARGSVRTESYYGKLKEPVVYLASFGRAFGVTTDGVFLNTQAIGMGQSIFNAPSVFSFYSPRFGLPGNPSMIAPQFGIETTATAIDRLNQMATLIYSSKGVPRDTTIAGSTGTTMDLSKWIALAGSSSNLVETMDLMLTHATSTSTEKNTIVAAINAISVNDPTARARSAAYLYAAYPRYQITR